MGIMFSYVHYESPNSYIRNTLRHSTGAKRGPRQSRRPSAAKRIIRAEVPKDTGPIYLQASFFRAAAAGDGVECAGSKILRKLRVSKSQPLATNPRHACDQRVANLTPETPYSPTPMP